jgi:hypothetical protein
VYVPFVEQQTPRQEPPETIGVGRMLTMHSVAAGEWSSSLGIRVLTM